MSPQHRSHRTLSALLFQTVHTSLNCIFQWKSWGLPQLLLCWRKFSRGVHSSTMLLPLQEQRGHHPLGNGKLHKHPRKHRRWWYLGGLCHCWNNEASATWVGNYQVPLGLTRKQCSCQCAPEALLSLNQVQQRQLLCFQISNNSKEKTSGFLGIEITRC